MLSRCWPLIMALSLSHVPAKANSAVQAREVQVVTATLDLAEPRAALNLLAGRGPWRAPLAGLVAKLELRFDAPLELTRVEAAACGETPFDDSAVLFADFDRARIVSEGGKRVHSFALAKSAGAPFQAQSLLIRFRNHAGLCLSSLRLFRGTTEIALRPLSVLDGGGFPAPMPPRSPSSPSRPPPQPSSSPSPSAASAPTALFDSRLETCWSRAKATGAAEVKFNDEVVIERLRVWSGDQRSAEKFLQSARAKTIRLVAPSRAETVTLADRAGMQVVALAAPLRTKSLLISADDAFGGDADEAQLCELQFGAGSGFAVPDVAVSLRAEADARRSEFAVARLGEILDHALSFADEKETWTLRLRSDGSAFMRGHSDNIKQPRAFSFLGTYRVLRATARGLHLELDGLRWHPNEEFDTQVCGPACGGKTLTSAEFLTDRVSISRTRDGGIFVRNETSRKRLGLNFRTFKARVSEGDD